jgi:hypothetical protein
MLHVACVVEGHGEVEATPILLRRLAHHVRPGIPIEAKVAIRSPRSKLLKDGELERAVEAAARAAGTGGAVLVLLDADDDCAATLGPRLLARARLTRSQMPISVVVAVREFEAWFLAAARSLRGVRQLAPGMEPPPQPEAVRGAKEWLNQHRPTQLPYRETIDQAALVSRMSIEEALTCSSFRKLARDLSALIDLATASSASD